MLRPRALGDPLKQHDLPTSLPRHLLSQAALAVACLAAGQAHALGLGRLNVQSALGETLRAEIELTSLSPEEENGLRVRVAAPDAFRAQGLDYNAVLAGAQVQLVRQANGRAVLRIQSERAVQEPFLDLLLDIRWSTGRLNREFTLLFDPPGSARAPVAPAEAAAPVVAPVVSQAAPAPGTAQPRAAAPAAPAAPSAPRGEPASAADGILVRAGDSLSRLASRYRLDGVSLDQMLVGLFRENPEAFIGSNMNLLRAGSRLRVPGRDGMAALPADEARRLVRAHSGSFDSVRQSLAAAAPKLPAEPERVARGAVQAQVSPAKPVATGGDRLTLSKPAAVASVPATPASQIAAANRDVEAARKLAEAARQEVSAAASAVASAAAPVVQAAKPEASAVASVALPVASAVPASAAKAVPPPPPAANPEPESGWMDWILSPAGAAGGVGVLLLGAVLAIRLGRQRKPSSSQETLFGESRLQPDSFFGVTGGQRVDTRDGASGVSSMSYSLSQLDAHGDVDPVAEADVYLAYGRDLQAEEILKEALRAQPERMAIRLKLLEVYAKRRDVRGYEQLATQLYAETKGSGEDWDKAQEMGRSIDPENPLYQPGGAPRAMFDDDAARPEPMNATTLPQAAPLSMQAEPEPEEPDAGPPSLIDLDLDIGLPVVPTPAAAPQVAAPAQPDPEPSVLDMDLDISEPMPLDGKKDNSLEFDLSDLGDLGGGTVSGNLDAETTARMNLTEQAPLDDDAPVTKVGGDSLLDAMHDLDDADPVMRQLELAEEFRQIGDVEGARDVLQELIAQVSSGPVYEKAKALLDELR